MNERRRILIVVNDPGFLLSHFVPLVRAAASIGDVEIATPEADGIDDVRALGYPVHVIPLDRSGMHPFGEWKLARALWRLYRARRPDVVHHITLKPVLYGTLAARHVRVPRIINAVTGLGYLFVSGGWQGAPLRAAIQTLFRRSFAHPSVRLVFENPDDRKLFTDRRLVRQDRTRVVGGAGVDTALFRMRPVPSGIPLVVLPARMLWDKGVAEFVAAARILRDRRVPARLALVGGLDVNRAAVPRSVIDQWVADGVVEWWGRRSDMPDVLAAAALVVLPSYREGCPKALLEAAATGRAIVTTDVPGCREVVRDGENGLVVPARDAVALAHAIERLLADPLSTARMGERSRERAEREFEASAVARSIVAEYTTGEGAAA